MSKTYALPASVHALSLPAEDQVMTLQIGLKLQNIEQLEEKLKAVSTPGSPDYGKYMEADEVNEMFNPSEESRAAVKAWLKDAGVTEVADFGWYINFATSVSNANSMLGSSFQNFMVDGVEKLRTLEYSIPDNLVDHVELLSPTTFFGRTKANMPVKKLARPTWRMGARQASNSSVNCAKLTEPPCLEEMYNYGGYNESADSGSRVGFGSFLNQSAIQTDLTLYQKDYGLPLTNFSVVLINGGEDHQDPKRDHGEANLDSQFMAASAKSLPMTQFITAGKP
jgi:tripeptidyl-peptidase-1